MNGSPDRTDADAARAMDALRRIVHALHAANARSTESLHVSAAQLFVLRQIDAHPGISMSEIATHTRSAQSSVSEVVSRLVGQGLVERRESDRDRRRSEMYLTPAGRRLTRSSRETVQERLVAGYERLTVKDQRTLATLLEQWIGAAELGGTPAHFFFSER